MFFYQSREYEFYSLEAKTIDSLVVVRIGPEVQAVARIGPEVQAVARIGLVALESVVLQRVEHEFEHQPVHAELWLVDNGPEELVDEHIEPVVLICDDRMEQQQHERSLDQLGVIDRPAKFKKKIEKKIYQTRNITQLC